MDKEVFHKSTRILFTLFKINTKDTWKKYSRNLFSFRCVHMSNHAFYPISSKIWKLGKLNHVAIATQNLNNAATFYKDVLGANISQPLPLPDHGVTTVFVELGETKLELLHPLGDKSPIKGFLEKNKNGGMHHICIEVNDIHKAVDDMKKNKIRLLSDEPRIGAHGKPVIFLHPKDCDGVLIELEQA